MFHQSEGNLIIKEIIIVKYLLITFWNYVEKHITWAWLSDKAPAGKLNEFLNSYWRSKETSKMYVRLM